ncbi:hypothetical protein, partial [Streptomyces roseolus]|uniref:hypothetical protein n=1 Tax=Streptomyces roseolus TaxID=67358 RepID=UPI00365708D9
MTEIRELSAGRTALGAAAMLALRPRWETEDALVELIDTRLRPDGYRLVGAFEDGHEHAVSVLGFREGLNTAWGHHVYVDDLSTFS